MTRLLYNPATAQLLPYPRQDDEPVIGLDPALVVLELIQLDPPSYDPATHRLEPTEAIDLQAGTVTRGWQVVPIAPAPPAPDWERFRSQLQTDNGFPAAWATILQGDSRAAIMLIASLSVWQAAPDQWGQFLAAVLACLSLLPFEQQAEVGLELLALAHSCHLDPAFLTALEGMLEGNAGQ